MVDVIRACDRIAPSDSTVLLTGETGTGKEVFARRVHTQSRRQTRPFIPVNCGAIPEALLESELFGYVKGAFTGAHAARKGRVSMAEGGTLFLDEIGDLPLALQVKLLRLLQERTYEPVGSNESISADFRLIAATHRNLSAEVQAGRFRADLYYRLMVCPVELPALRERKGDVVVLFEHFWQKRGESRLVEPELLRQLERYPWPGNVRELENLVERLQVCTEGSVVRAVDLPPPYRSETPSIRLLASEPAAGATVGGEAAATTTTASAAGSESFTTVAVPSQTPITTSSEMLAPPFAGVPVDLPMMLKRLEDSYIDAALKHCGGNKKAAADMLGLQRTTLVEKLRRRARDAPESQAAIAS